VVAVDDGSEAVAALSAGDFDVVLMDVQMPVMDGFEATARIRALDDERLSRIPIVALTAHALDGDRDRCLQAGMDAYVSKPFRSSELFATIEQLVGASAEPSQREEPAQPDPVAGADEPIDRLEAMELVGGMPELIPEIAALVLGEVGTLSDEIGRAIEADDAETVARHAHRLKGGVGSIAATPSHQATLALEHAARGGNQADMRLAWDDLSRQLKLLQPELEALARDGVSAWA
jgi:CheY-like chemotaxis protein